MALDSRIIQVNSDGSYLYSGSILNGVGQNYDGKYARPNKEGCLTVRGEDGSQYFLDDGNSHTLREDSWVDTTVPYFNYRREHRSSGYILRPYMTQTQRIALITKIIADWNGLPASQRTLLSDQVQYHGKYLFYTGSFRNSYPGGGRHRKRFPACFRFSSKKHHYNSLSFDILIHGYRFDGGSFGLTIVKDGDIYPDFPCRLLSHIFDFYDPIKILYEFMLKAYIFHETNWTWYGNFRGYADFIDVSARM